MQQRWKWLFALAVFLLALSGFTPASYAGVPDVLQSFYVPQSGSVTTPTEGAAAIANARRCPNDDGIRVLKLNSRLKVVVKASDGSPIVGIPASDICVLFNGGTPAQGFSGVGDDSIIANFQFNPLANCPDIRCVQADAPTDGAGVAYITWIGATPGSPGTGTRDPFRKWGGYAGSIPVVVLGFQLQGKLTSGSALGSYTAHVKSLDTVVSGLPPFSNAGELVTQIDVNPVQAASVPGQPYQYKLDFNNDGFVNVTGDLNFIKAHVIGTHRCNFPLNP